MIVIGIPTTVFVKKIVYAQKGIPFTPRNQTTNIKLTEDDELFDYLKYNGQLHKLSKARKTLTALLHVELSPAILRQVGGDRYAIGAYLDRTFKRELCKIVEARSQSHTEKLEAIRDFLNTYGIDEEEYSVEAAIKRVQRHIFKKKVSKLAMISSSSVRPLLPILTQNAQYSDAELEMMYQAYRRQYPIYFYTQRRQERKELPAQCRAWILRHIGNRSPQYIAQKMRVNPATVWKRANAFQCEFQNRPKPTAQSVLLEPMMC
jgi:hypothetical protein